MEDGEFDVVEDYPLTIMKGATVNTTDKAWTIKRKDILLKSEQFMRPITIPPRVQWDPMKDLTICRGATMTILTGGAVEVSAEPITSWWVHPAIVGAMAVGVILGAVLL